MRVIYYEFIMSQWENRSCYSRICQVSRSSNVGQTSSNSRIYITGQILYK